MIKKQVNSIFDLIGKKKLLKLNFVIEMNWLH